jgi:hypothetical protein
MNASSIMKPILPAKTRGSSHCIPRSVKCFTLSGTKPAPVESWQSSLTVIEINAFPTK